MDFSYLPSCATGGSLRKDYQIFIIGSYQKKKLFRWFMTKISSHEVTALFVFKTSSVLMIPPDKINLHLFHCFLAILHRAPSCGMLRVQTPAGSTSRILK